MAGKVPSKKEDPKAGKKAIPPKPPAKGAMPAKGTAKGAMPAKGAEKPVGKKEDMKTKMDRLRAMKGK